ncbi:UNKNOWN [Stylonychia lemnae]|uniref:Serine aminopeptidase S33 domain-containing protein n=1 Tax=Stylonychia lemnae TaxID=5949 RepID=A0A078AJ41_STYLE|nr:UNKNOWN [Stylonychia lemnae]|eukprot:CDW81911.1 UNKNOWN [Stylonychia lemnae]
MQPYLEYIFPEQNFIDFKIKSGTVKLQTYRWPSSKDFTKGLVIIFPGYGSYVPRYSLIAQLYTQEGYDVMGYDNEGFGNSDGLRGYIGDIDVFYNTGYEFMMKIFEFYHSKDIQSVIAFGFSLGGQLSVGIQMLLERNQQRMFDQLILNAPNLGLMLCKPIDEIRAEIKLKFDDDPTAEVEYNPFLDYGEGLDDAWNQDDKIMVRNKVYCKSLYFNSKVTEELEQYYYQIKVPVYIALPTNESVVNNQLTREFYDIIKRNNPQNILHEYDAKHLLLYDGDLYKVIVSQQIKWLNELKQ